MGSLEMDRDTTGKYEQFAALSDPSPPPTQGGQSTQQQFYPKLDFGNQLGSPLNQNTNQPNSGPPGQAWPNQQGRIEDELASFRLNEQEQKILRNCKSATFFGITLPICTGYVLYSKYNALKHLRPLPPLRLFFGVGFAYIFSKFISMGICMSALRVSSPEFDEKVDKIKQLSLKKRMELASNELTQPPPKQPLNQDDYQNLQQQRFSNPNNPYLAANQQKAKEFVDDNYDFGSYKPN